MPKSSGSSTSASTLKLNAKVDNIARDHEGRRLRRGLPRGRRPHRQARLYSGRRGGEGARRRARCCARWKARTSRCSAAASSSMAAAIPRSTSRAPPSGWAPTEAIIVYRRTRDRMPAHDFEVEEALEEGVMMKWLSTIKTRWTRASSRSRRWRSTTRAFRSRPASSRRWRPTRWCSRSARTSTCRCSRACPGLEIKDGVVQVAPNMMTGHAGIFAGGDMVPSERTVTVAVGHGKKAARHIDAWLRGDDLRAGGKARARRASTSSTPGTTATRRRRCGRCWKWRAAPRPSRRCRAGSTRATRSTRRAAACPAATASSATTATASARTTP